MTEDIILITIRGHQPYMSQGQLAEEFSKTKRTIANRLAGMREEIQKGRYPECAIADDRINYFAFLDYITYYKRLQDKNMRKAVPAFDPSKYMEISGFQQRIMKLEE